MELFQVAVVECSVGILIRGEAGLLNVSQDGFSDDGVAKKVN